MEAAVTPDNIRERSRGIKQEHMAGQTFVVTSFTPPVTQGSVPASPQQRGQCGHDTEPPSAPSACPAQPRPRCKVQLLTRLKGQQSGRNHTGHPWLNQREQKSSHNPFKFLLHSRPAKLSLVTSTLNVRTHNWVLFPAPEFSTYSKANTWYKLVWETRISEKQNISQNTNSTPKPWHQYILKPLWNSLLEDTVVNTVFRSDYVFRMRWDSS